MALCSPKSSRSPWPCAPKPLPAHGSASPHQTSASHVLRLKPPSAHGSVYPSLNLPQPMALFLSPPPCSLLLPPPSPVTSPVPAASPSPRPYSPSPPPAHGPVPRCPLPSISPQPLARGSLGAAASPLGAACPSSTPRGWRFQGAGGVPPWSPSFPRAECPGWPLCWGLWGLEVVLLLVRCYCAGEQRAPSDWSTVGRMMLVLPAEGFRKIKFSSALPAACDGDSVGCGLVV